MGRMAAIYHSLKECVVRMTVTDANGDQATGAGFHIGQGYFVTARHVVEGKAKVVAEQMEGLAMINSIDVKSAYFPADPKIDLAVLQTEIHFTDYYLQGYKSMQGRTLDDFRGIPLGALVDDAVSDDHILEEVLLMGFPPIPLSDRPELVVVRGEINATMLRYIGPNYYYHIISTVARGGFSGGPVVDSNGFLLGVFTESLIANGKETELGFAAVLSIEPLLTLLKDNGIVLKQNRNILSESEAEDYDEWYEARKKENLKWYFPDRL